MKNIFIALCVSSTFSLADTECIAVDKKTVEVSWKAYKTPAKLGVGGIFDDVVYRAETKEARGVSTLLLDASVTIDTQKVNSKNEGRDLKLVNNFFKMMRDEKITAKVISVKEVNEKEGTMILDISMNGIIKHIPMNYTYKKGLVKAVGYIDIFDFQASKALSSINKACFDLHAGKTWNDVTIGFELNVNKIACQSK